MLASQNRRPFEFWPAKDPIERNFLWYSSEKRCRLEIRWRGESVILVSKYYHETNSIPKHSLSCQDGWKDKEANPPIGKVVPTPTGREMTSGKVWVQWPCELDKSYSYRVGLNGKMDLRIAKAGIAGHYQPDTLIPVLVISKSRADEKPC